MAAMDNALENYNFVFPPDENLKCCICLEVASDPRQEEECGKLFCKDCIESNVDHRCPTCRHTSPHYFQDKKSLREILSLGVYCENKERGCEWQGTVESIAAHLDVCGLSYITCTKKCLVNGESLQILRKDLDDHLKNSCPNRDYMCEYCGKKGTFAQITGDHIEACRSLMVRCSACLCYLPSEDLQDHAQKTCGYTVVACPLREKLGCQEKMHRKDVKDHEESEANKHLLLALKKLDTLEENKSEATAKTGGEKISSTGDDIKEVAEVQALKLEVPHGLSDSQCLEAKHCIDLFHMEVKRAITQLQHSSNAFVSLEVLASSLEFQLTELTQKLKKTLSTSMACMSTSSRSETKSSTSIQKSAVINQREKGPSQGKDLIQRNKDFKNRIIELEAIVRSGSMLSAHQYPVCLPHPQIPVLMQDPSQVPLDPHSAPIMPPYSLPMGFESRSSALRGSRSICTDSSSWDSQTYMQSFHSHPGGQYTGSMTPGPMGGVPPCPPPPGFLCGPTVWL